MSLSQRIARIRKFATALTFASIGAAGFLTLGAGTAQATPYKARCVAAAETHWGREIRGTREAVVRRGFRRACRVALRECEVALDRRRYQTGRPFHRASCQIQKRERVAVHNRVRCAAEAFTRRGRSLSETKAVETRRSKSRACGVALNRCEARLDHKRHVTGKSFPYARCEVTGSRKVAFWDAPSSAVQVTWRK